MKKQEAIYLANEMVISLYQELSKAWVVQGD